MQYCLDSNIFIQAKNFYYDFAICPGFWDWLDQQTGIVGSIVPVCEELTAGDDTLAVWAKDRKNTGFFEDIAENDVQEAFRAIAVYVTNNYKEHNAGKFLDGADPWLIAYCQIYDCTLVTGEVLSPEAKKVKLPNICEIFGVDWTDNFTILKNLEACFVLDS